MHNAIRMIAGRKVMLAGAAAVMLAAGLATPLLAQRDPAYDAARSSGNIGEKMDGYLGIVGATTPDLKRLVDDINIKRRAVYAARAQENNATLEEYAISAGCQLVLKTVPGEKYQAPDGAWHTRTAEPPVRDPRCG
ncbi:MAG: hypothetical protein APF82_05815 [Sphingomonadales bacterium BRH_c42]|nr:MAG: hypothetical protein APF82_05815 [Sphingomonadales bacterium BRH_c42]